MVSEGGAIEKVIDGLNSDVRWARSVHRGIGADVKKWKLMRFGFYMTQVLMKFYSVNSVQGYDI
jgi:hypothetical protein